MELGDLWDSMSSGYELPAFGSEPEDEDAVLPVVRTPSVSPIMSLSPVQDAQEIDSQETLIMPGLLLVAK